MEVRRLEDIEEAFRDMGLDETTWGKSHAPDTETQIEPSTQLFIRIATTTVPLERSDNANLAQPLE